MSTFVLKFIAVIFMFVDHVKYAFPSCYNNFTLYFGRIAFPLFAFCSVQAYSHTSNISKYIKRLLIAGVISEIPFLLFYRLPTIDSYGLNIEFTLALGLLAIFSFEKVEGKLKKWLIVIGICILAQVTHVDYQIFGILMIFSFYIFKDSKFKTFLASSLVVSGKYIYRILVYGKTSPIEYYIFNWICTMIPLFIVLFYNGKKGPSLKWFFYIFYPLHLLLLYLFSPYTFNLLNL